MWGSAWVTREAATLGEPRLNVRDLTNTTSVFSHHPQRFFLKYIFLCKYILVKPQAASQFCFQRALMKRLASPGSGGGERLSWAMCRGCRQHPGRMWSQRESSLPLILWEQGWDFPPHPSLLGARAQKTPTFCSPGLGFTPHITVTSPQNSSWGSFINMIFFFPGLIERQIAKPPRKPPCDFPGEFHFQASCYHFTGLG